ncbi:MAG: T9SS C-terminal target domain-containing protein [Saprospirales bacterium]|nr:MAG: T9SS C-terminal target domain-containing protein [Saprospirales bacterium]
MKNALMIIFSLFISSQVLSQTYESIFGVESTQWNITMGNLWGMATAEHRVVGDTLINNLLYQIVDGYDNTGEIMGFLREDSTHSRAWYLGRHDNDEYLIMDLNLNVGDSMFIGGNWNAGPQYYYVDSVYFKNGKKHIQFNLEVYFLDNEKFTLIEGVTSNLGFRYQDKEYINAFPTILLCAFKDGQQIFGTGDCIISSVLEESTPMKFEIYPNPFQNVITIDFNGTHEVLFASVYDLNGRRVFIEKINRSVVNTLDLKKLRSGIYFLHFQDEVGNFKHTTRIIKGD